MICPVVGNEMSPETKPEIRLQIGHVLYIDIVGYSKLLMHEQTAQLEILEEDCPWHRTIPQR